MLTHCFGPSQNSMLIRPTLQPSVCGLCPSQLLFKGTVGIFMQRLCKPTSCSPITLEIHETNLCVQTLLIVLYCKEIFSNGNNHKTYLNYEFDFHVLVQSVFQGILTLLRFLSLSLSDLFSYS